MKNKTNKKNKQITYEKELIKELFRTIANFSLYSVYFALKFIAHEIVSGTPKSVYQALRQSEEFAASVSWKQFQRSFLYIKKRGDLEVITHRSIKKLRITQQGIQRLSTIIPEYQKQRDWDKKLYLITYDIPVEFNIHREQIRDAIYRLGGGKLQDSVYITPYDPRTSLSQFVEESKIQGDILVSDLGKDGSIAGKSIPQIVSEVYKLDNLNEQYKKYIKQYTTIVRHYKPKQGQPKFGFKIKEKIDPMQAELDFIIILRKDPQLPFELLPQYWQGDHAYKLYKKIIQS